MSYQQYTVQCGQCGKQMNTAAGVNGRTRIADPVQECPDCGSSDLKKIADGWHAVESNVAPTDRGTAMSESVTIIVGKGRPCPVCDGVGLIGSEEGVDSTCYGCDGSRKSDGTATDEVELAPAERNRLVVEALAKLSDADIMQRAAAVYDAYDEKDLAGCRAAILRAFTTNHSALQEKRTA